MSETATAQLTDCDGKIPHATRADALRVTRRLRGTSNAYRCPYCDAWHVAHDNVPAPRRQTRERDHRNALIWRPNRTAGPAGKGM